MAYSNVWSNSIPAGTEAAKNIDDQIRQLRLDIFERMNDLVVDWTDDPVVFSPGGSGSTLIIPATAFQGDPLFPPASGTQISWLYQTVQAQGTPIYAPLTPYVSVGSEIVKLEWLVDRETVPTITGSLYHTDFSITPGFGTQDHTISTSAGTLQIMDSGAISITIDADKYYTLELHPGTSGTALAKLYAVRVTIG